MRLKKKKKEVEMIQLLGSSSYKKTVETSVL